MAAFDFPSSPSVNQTYTANGVTWKWNGTMWMRITGAGYLEKIEEGNSKIEVDDSGSGNITATTDGTERLRIDSSGDLGLGTQTPNKNSWNKAITLEGSSNCAYEISDNGTLAAAFALQGNDRIELINFRAGPLTFKTQNIERLRIDSSGSVAIGVNSPSDKLHVGGNNAFIRVDRPNGNPGLTLIYNSTNSTRADIDVTTGGDLRFATNNSTERLRITSAGHVRVNTGDLRVGDDTDSNAGSQTISVGSVSSGSGGIGIFANPTNGNSFVQFGDGTSSADQYRGYMNYRHADDSLRFGTAGTDRLLISNAGGHKIVCNESYHAANLSECNTNRLAVNINQTRQGQTKGIALGCVGAGSGSTGIQAYDTSNNSANTLELNPFGGNLLYGDTASDLSNDHKFIAVGAKHAFQYDGNAGTYLSVILSPANGSVDLEADARSGAYPDLRFITTNDEQLRVLAAGHIWKKNDGALWHGTPDINDFSNAGRSNYNKVSIRAGDPNDGTSPTNDNSAIKIYPAGNRGTTAGTLSGGIAWQHLDPSNGSWDSNYGAGSQIWMGSAIHDTPGQERSRFNLWMNSGTTGNSNPGNLAIEAYPSGIVRHPKVPAFMVRNTTNSGAFSAEARATWNTSILNNGSHFDMTNNIFTAPVDGIYSFCCMMLSQNNTRLFHNFRVNNTIIEGTRSESYQGTSYQTNTITMVYSLSANDYVDVYVRNNQGYGGNYTNFNGFLVG